MGVGFNMLTISDTNIARLLADPPLVHRFLEPDDPAPYLASIGVGRKPGLIARLRGAREVLPPTVLPNLVFADGERANLDLDKSWDGLHFLLGKARPGRPELKFIDSGGLAVGNVDATGYGTPAKVMRPHEVQALAIALSDLQADAIRDAYVPDELVIDGVYPKGLWRDDPKVRDYLAEHFSDMKRFVSGSAASGMGLLTHAY